MEDLKKTCSNSVIIGLAMMASLLVYAIMVVMFEGVTVQPPGRSGDAGTGRRPTQAIFFKL